VRGPLDWPSISLHGWGDTRVSPQPERDRRACTLDRDETQGGA